MNQRPFNILDLILGIGPQSLFESVSDFFLSIKERGDKMVGYRMVLFNIFMGVLMMLKAFNLVPEEMAVTEEEIKNGVDALLMALTFLWAIGNIILRAFTKTSIFKKK